MSLSDGTRRLGTISRRGVLRLSAGAALAGALPISRPALASEDTRHGLSVFDDLKYPANFSYFDYVDPEAPQGGTLRFGPPSWAYNQNPNTFNTLNGFVLKGEAPPRIELTFTSLMTRAVDEPDAVYCLAARSVGIEEAGNAYRFALREEARFHDGTPVRAEDVVFSLTTLKAHGHPLLSQTIKEMSGVEAADPGTVIVRFSGKQTRQLPLYVATLPIFSKAWWDGRDFAAATLEAPLGSGPYKLGKFEVGKFIELDRVADWWGNDLPVVKGHFNFARIRIDFFRDRTIAFEAFKKGDVRFHEDFFSKVWATGYDFPAHNDGRVKKREFPDNRPAGAQGWFFNTRRQKFADPRTREAIGLAFDFEWSNANLFFGLYQRTHSFFENSEMMATGLPGPEERALLEPFRDTLPAEVFGEPWLPPVSDGSGRDRRLLRQADTLLREAGWARRDGLLHGPDGKPFEIEFLSNSPAFERILQPYIGNLRRLGVTGSIRLVDASQYQSRLDGFDFDVVGRRFALSATPDEGVRQYWSSAAADTPGSSNLAGIKHPAIDALIEKMIHATSRAEMTFAARALDRVLRAGRYWVPNWYKPVHTVAMWDEFGWPDKKPRYDFPVETTWWYDKEKAAKLDSSN